MSSTSLHQLPTLNKTVVYLDYNVFVKAVKDSNFRANLKELRETEKILFPFNRIHISEVNRIDKTKESEVLFGIDPIP